MGVRRGPRDFGGLSDVNAGICSNHDGGHSHAGEAAISAASRCLIAFPSFQPCLIANDFDDRVRGGIMEATPCVGLFAVLLAVRRSSICGDGGNGADLLFRELSAASREGS